MLSLFKEHRLTHLRAEQFGYASTAAAKKAVRADSRVTERQTQANLNSQNAQRTQVKKMNQAAEDLGRNTTFSRSGVVGSRGTEIIGGSYDENTGYNKPGTTFRTGLTQNVTAEQSRQAVRMRAESDTAKMLADKVNSELKNNTYDSQVAGERESQAYARLDALYARNDAKNAAAAAANTTARSNLTNPVNPTLPTSRKPFGNRTSENGVALNNAAAIISRSNARGQTRSQRLGLTPPSNSTMSSTMPAPAPAKTAPAAPVPGAAPVTTGQADIPSNVDGTFTTPQKEASAALQGDSMDAPTTLDAARDEQMAAINPTLESLGMIRDEYKIYQSGTQALIDGRGKQIEDYKTNSQDRVSQIADAKISQSKSNRDLQEELIAESRDRAERDQLLTSEKNERAYQREEDRIIGENKATIERMTTQLGGRYGGFGSGKGLALIQSARDQGSSVLRQLTEDRIYARQEESNKIQDIEDKWNDNRKLIFNQHDQNVTAAYTTAMEAAQKIDDNALTEEGDQSDDAIALMKTTFDTFDKIWTATGTALTTANQKALEERDKVRKETYDQQQDALKNIYSGLAVLPSSSSTFTTLEKAAGMTPGTIASTKSNEERRIAISEANLRVSQDHLNLDIKKFVQDGNKIDDSASKTLGYIVTSDGRAFRDSAGNIVNYVGANGAVTSSIENDQKLFGSDNIGINSAANFSRYALQVGDIIPGSPYHKGGEYDIDNRAGTPIPAWMSGTVVKVNNKADGDYGNYVDISDGTHVYRYAHLQSVNVTQGQKITGMNNGQNVIIGLMGNSGNVMGSNGVRPMAGDMQTGSHLHVEVRTGNDFDTGKVTDALDVGMLPGTMQAGKVTWVDDMRTKMKQGAPIASSKDGGTISGDGIDTPWQEIDNQILQLAQDSFKTPDGKVDQRAIGLVYDYMNEHKMGSYQIAYDGQGAIAGVEKASAEAAYTQATRNRNVSQDRQLVTNNIIDPTDFFSKLQDGTLADMGEGEAQQYMTDMGYVVEPGRLFGHNIREMNATELQLLNQKRQAQGLPSL